ncbi:response regulator [Paenibacillus septentrionalis]|uniref:Response regulator n=1 Tax=Paenibacillus septentrionalis TaxID=429342 RepID=A0ABW1V3S9_9BACL
MISVMLVDDEPWNREIVKRFGAWEELNMKIVCEADDGAEAIAYLQQHSLQLVITDMKMPGVDGGKLMEYIREHYPDMQLIVISGYDDFEYARKALRCNAVEYMLKPIDGAALNEALRKCREVLQQQQAVVDVSLVYVMDAYKRSIEQTFQKLQAEQLEQLFIQMEAKWVKQQLPASLRQQLMDELLRFAQELSEKHNLALAVQPKTDALLRLEWDELTAFFMQLLQQLIEQRKYKTKLNLLDVKSYIEQHAKEPLMLEELAGVFFVSKEYLSKQFKQELGISVTDYIMQLRMEEARLKIEEGKLSIKEIAESIGYEDISYFYRVFRKYFGIAPGEMRKQHEV